MPELPEVESVVRGLRAKIVKRKIVSVDLHRTGLRFPFPAQLNKKIAGHTITSVDRFAKYALIELDDGARLLLHLGMSGRMSYEDKKTYERGKHDHAVFTFDKGPLLIFNDARRFGMLDYLPKNAETHRLLKHVGIDPLSDDLAPEFLFEKISTRKTTFKAILMDQKLIAGLGNIYVCEALFRAKMNPKRLGTSFTKAEAKKLVPEIKAVLQDAIEAGGSSLRDYVQPDGALGFFQDKFRVYGRTGKPCVVCKTPIIRFVQNGRSTFACPKCQKIP